MVIVIMTSNNRVTQHCIRYGKRCSCRAGSKTCPRDPEGALGKPAIRGREQQLIDYYGGIGSRRVANSIRGVSKANPMGRFYHSQSNSFFGNIAPYTGY